MARTSDLFQTGVGGTYIETIGSPNGYDILINGSNHYLNFNSVVGSSGYGFRDNGGTIEFKNSGGSWTAIGSGGSTSPLTTKGDLYGFSTVDARVPVGSNGLVLQADSTQALGVRYGTVLPIGGGFGQSMDMQTSTLTGNQTLFPVGLIKWNGASSVTIQGLPAPTTSNFCIVQNATTNQTISIQHQSSSASANNRVITPSAGTTIVNAGQSATFYYDTTTARWRLHNIGFINSVSSPFVVTAGNLTMPAVSSGGNGYATNTMYNDWYAKLSSNFSGAGVVYKTGTVTTGADGTVFSWNPVTLRFGVGVGTDYTEASGHFKSDTAETLATLSGISATLTLFNPLAAPNSYSVTQITGHMNAPTGASLTQTAGHLYVPYTLSGTSSTVGGATSYVASDNIDYKIYSEDSTPKQSVVYATVSTIITTNGDDSVVTWTDDNGGTQSIAQYLVYRQVNGGGYTDYRYITANSGGFDDDSTGWTSVAGTPPPFDPYTDYIAANVTYDYQLWQAGNDGTEKWSVVKTIVTNTDNNDGKPFVWSLGWTINTSGTETPTNVRIYRQINAGGYNNYYDLGSAGTSFVDDNTVINGASGSPAPSPQYPDFIANNTTTNFSAQSKGTAPDSSVLYSPSTYDIPFTDNNSGDSYLIQHYATGASPVILYVDTTNSLNYEFAQGNYITQDTTTFSAGGLGSPTTFGLIANGSNWNRDYDFYNYNGAIYSASSGISSTIDPNDSNYYYVVLAFSGISTSAKILQQISGGGYNNSETSATSPISDIGSNFTSTDVVVTPNSIYRPAGLFESRTTDLTSYASVILRTMEATGNSRLDFQNSAGTRTGYISSPYTGGVNISAGGNGNLQVTQDSVRIDIDAGGTGAFYAAGSQRFAYSNGGMAMYAPSGGNAGMVYNGTYFVTVDSVGVTLSSPLLTIAQSTLGNIVQRIQSTATNDDPQENLYQNRVATTNNTQTTLHTFTLSSNTTYTIEASIIARRTGGSAGTAQDSAGYKIIGTYKNVGGTATLVGAISVVHTAEDQAGWDATFTLTGATVLCKVTGATNNNITWHMTARVYNVST